MIKVHNQHEQLLSTAILARAIANGLCRWEQFSGQQVNHTHWGSGVITAVTTQQGGGRIITIVFGPETGLKRFEDKSLADPKYFSAISIPDALYTIIVADEIRRSTNQAERTWVKGEVPRTDDARNITATSALGKSDQMLEAIRSQSLKAREEAVSSILTRYDVTCLYYMASIDNIPSILAHGILSRHEVARRGLKFADCSAEEMQEKRARKLVRDGRTVHDYANLYFATHTPTQRAMTHANDWGVIPISQEELVFIEIDAVRAFMADGMAFSDGNAAQHLTRFYTELDDLEHLKWPTIWKPRVRVPDDRRYKAAEVLVPSQIPPEWFTRVVVYSEHAADLLGRALLIYNMLNKKKAAVNCRYEYDDSLYF